MGQRVNLQYSVEIEELEHEVRRLFTNAYGKLDTVQTFCAEPPDPALSLEAIKDIEDIRIRLSDIDHRLNDINTIVTGYLSYKASELSPQVSTPPQLSEEEIEAMSIPPEVNIDSLEEAMEKYRNVQPT